MKPSFFTKNKISSSRKSLLNEFQKEFNIRFKDINLLNQAFTHRSVTNEFSDFVMNNERLEFLGDAVLGMVTSSLLYEKYSEQPEGDLAKIKSAVVSEASLSQIATKLQISKYLLLGKGEEKSGGRNKKAILADCVEAIIGAYYLDSGYKNCRAFILKFMEDVIDGIEKNQLLKDFKTILQEYCQKTFKVCPTYELLKKTGPDHDKTFWIKVLINNMEYGTAKGKSKKEAQQNAAKIALEKIQN